MKRFVLWIDEYEHVVSENLSQIKVNKYAERGPHMPNAHQQQQIQRQYFKLNERGGASHRMKQQK